MIDSIGLPDVGCEPTAEELAAIEWEWPLIEAGLAELDAEIAEILHGPAAAAWVWRRARRLRRRPLDVAPVASQRLRRAA